MAETTTNLYECKHCGGIGTCKNGADGSSCLACAKKNELHFWEYRNRNNLVGLMCGSCGGLGEAEPLTERIHNRTPPVLAFILVFGSLIIISLAAYHESKFFSELLTFSSVVIGSVSGFYFSNKEK
jgi:hypothetical protein